MPHKMGKTEINEANHNSKPSKSAKHGKSFRRAVLGSNTLVLFITPSYLTDQITHTQISRGEAPAPENCSPFQLFDKVKEVNRYMVKGTKVYESLKELRLCGWVSQYTLLLTGPAEDMKVIKHAWIKRYLKSPLGFFIKDVGIIQDFVVELLPQSPFLSLKTALFDAVADLNNQSVYPNKDNLREYLRKHYPDVKLPEIKHVYECLGRLIKERRLYHNGHGYFIICNENVLNELKSFNTANDCQSLYHSSAESAQIKGFALSSTLTTSSSPGQTDLDVNSNSINTSNSAETSTATSAGELGFPSHLGSSRSSSGGNPVKNFFKKHGKLVKRHDQNDETSKTQSPDKPLSTSDTNSKKSENSHSPIKHSDKSHEKEEKSHFTKDENEKSHVTKREKTEKSHISKRESTHENDVKPHKSKDDSEIKLNVESITENGSSSNYSPDTRNISNGKPKLKRSQSLGATDRKGMREVTFAIVGMPCNNTNSEKTDQTNELSGYLKRSHSLGAGSKVKNYYRRPPCDVNSKTVSNEEGTLGETEIRSGDFNLDPYDAPLVFHDDGNTIVDEGDRSSTLSFTHNHSNERDEHFDNSQMDSTDIDKAPELLYNYENLGSSISFHKNHEQYTIMDLSSPPKSTSLAGEMKEAFVRDKSVNRANDEAGSSCKPELDNLLSPRSRQKFDGNPYGSQYFFDMLDSSAPNESSTTGVGSEHIEVCEDENQFVKTKEEGNDSCKRNKTKSRPSSRNSEQRKQNQKERNSLIFDEKRSSLKVMGMV